MECFELVLHQGIPLGVGFETDGDTEAFHGGEVVYPETRDDLEEQGAVDFGDGLTTEFCDDGGDVLLV